MPQKPGKSKVFSREYLEARFNRKDMADLLSIVDTDMRTVALSFNKSLTMLGRKNSVEGRWVYIYWNKLPQRFAFIAKKQQERGWKDRFRGSVTMTYTQALKRLQGYLNEGKIELKESDIY